MTVVDRPGGGGGAVAHTAKNVPFSRQQLFNAKPFHLRHQILKVSFTQSIMPGLHALSCRVLFHCANSYISFTSNFLVILFCESI